MRANVSTTSPNLNKAAFRPKNSAEVGSLKGSDILTCQLSANENGGTKQISPIFYKHGEKNLCGHCKNYKNVFQTLDAEFLFPALAEMNNVDQFYRPDGHYPSQQEAHWCATLGELRKRRRTEGGSKEEVESYKPRQWNDIKILWPAKYQKK
jgi:hypothetical protein